MSGVPGKRVHDVVHGRVLSATEGLWSALAGDGEAIVNALERSFDKAAIAAFLRNGDWYKEDASTCDLRGIMDKNFFGIKEAMKVWGARILACPEFRILYEDPICLRNAKGGAISSDVSRRVCFEAAEEGNHILVYYPGLSPKFLANVVGIEYSPTTCCCTHGWYLVRKEIYPGSLNKGWEEQLSLLDRTKDDVPESVVLFYADIIARGITNTPLLGFTNIIGRALNVSLNRNSRHSLYGFYEITGRTEDGQRCLAAFDATDDGPNPVVGLATIRIG